MGQGAARDQVMVSGTQRIPQTPVSIATGKANTLDCGGPLQIRVTATKTGAAAGRLLARDSAEAGGSSEPMLHINANVVGASGEIYSTFLKGEGFNSRPPKPTFSIVQAHGKPVANGNLEYG